MSRSLILLLLALACAAPATGAEPAESLAWRIEGLAVDARLDAIAKEWLTAASGLARRVRWLVRHGRAAWDDEARGYPRASN